MKNPEGSRAVSLLLLARKHQKLKVSQRQRSILIGSLLGDAYLSARGQIFIDHSILQEEYVRWKYKELMSLAYKHISFVPRQNHLDGSKNQSCRFILRQYFRSWRPFFYGKDGKYLSQDVINLLDELSLAVWYMDDGYYSRRGSSCEIATDQFSQNELEACCKTINHKFGLQFRLNSKGRLYGDRQQTKIFFKLIKPHVIPSMEYKIALTP